MPARAAYPPGTLPARFIGRASLPEHEIERVLLPRVIRIGASLGGQPDHLLTTEPAQATIVRDAAHAEIDVALTLVGMALRLEPDDQLHDLRDRLACPGHHIGRQHVEGRQAVPLD